MKHKNGERTRAKILDFIKSYYATRQYTPTLTEISDSIDVSKTAIHNNLRILREAGEINFIDGEFRTITLPTLKVIDIWQCPECRIPLLNTSNPFCVFHPDTPLKQKKYIEMNPND